MAVKIQWLNGTGSEADADRASAAAKEVFARAGVNPPKPSKSMIASTRR